MTPVFQGFPIRTSSDQSLFTNSPRLIAGYNVLHRLLVPRHPPIALSSLSIIYKDARVHCEILKKRASPPPTSHQQATRPANGPQEGATNRQPTLQDPTTCKQATPTLPTPTPHKAQAVLARDDSQSMFHQPEPSSREHTPRN